MTFGSSGTGTGMDNSIPKVREREGNRKNPFPQFGNGKGMKKSIPKIREREGNEKIHSHNSGKGIKGFHSWEWPGTGIPAHPWILTAANMKQLLSHINAFAILSSIFAPKNVCKILKQIRQEKT